MLRILILLVSLFPFSRATSGAPKCGFYLPDKNCFQCDKSYLKNDSKVLANVKDRKFRKFNHLSETRYANYNIEDSKYSEESLRYGATEMRLECFEGGGIRLVQTMKPPKAFLPSGDEDKRRDVSKYWLEEAEKLFALGAEITTMSEAFSGGKKSAHQGLDTPLGFLRDYRGFYFSRNTAFAVTPLKEGKVDLEVSVDYQESPGE